MRNIAVELIMTPYATPSPRHVESPPNVWPKGSIKTTLFVGRPNQARGANTLEREKQHRQSQKSFFHDLDGNLESLFQLQDQVVGPIEDFGIHKGKFDAFMTGIACPEQRLYRLYPIPSFDLQDLKNVFQTLLDDKVVARRISWLVHSLMYRYYISVDAITDFFLRLQVRDSAYYVGAVHQLYVEGLINRAQTLDKVVQWYPEESMDVFMNEIIQYYKVLKNMMTSAEWTLFVKKARLKLIEKPASLVQLALSEASENVSNLMIGSINQRVKSLQRIVDGKFCPAFGMMKMFMILESDQQGKKFVDQIELAYNEEGLDSDVLDFTIGFPQYHLLCSVISACIKKSHGFGSINTFLRVVFERPENIESWAIYALEMMYQNVFSYEEFLNILPTYLNQDRHTTIRVLKEFPTLKTDNHIVDRILSMLQLLDPSCDDNNRLRNCLLNPFTTIDEAKALPCCLKCVLCLSTLTDEAVSDVAQLMCDLGVTFLLPITVNYITVPRSAHLLEQLWPYVDIIQAHGCLKRYMELCFNSDNTDLQRRLMVCYPEDAASYHPVLNQSKKILSVTGLLQQYSYLCSISLYNCCLARLSETDCDALVEIFLKDAIEFGRIPHDVFADYLRKYFKSLQGTGDQQSFVKLVVSASVATSNTWEQKEASKDFLMHLYQLLIDEAICRLSDILYWTCVFDRTALPLILGVVTNIVQNNPNQCHPNDILSKDVIDAIPDPTILANLLLNLKKCKPLKCSQEIIGCLRDPMSAENIRYSSIYLSLVPESLMVDDIDEALEFFLQECSLQSVYLWTFYLKMRPCIEQSSLPINFSGSNIPVSHLFYLQDYFERAFQTSPTDIMTLAWILICDSEVQANRVCRRIRIRVSDNRICPGILSAFLLPAVNYCSDNCLEELCGDLINSQHLEYWDEETCRCVAMFFVCFVSRHWKVETSPRLIQESALKTLDILFRLCVIKSKYIVFVVDCYNYIVAKFCCENSKFDLRGVSERLAKYMRMRVWPKHIENSLLVIQPLNYSSGNPPLYEETGES